jgi:hypothetical protein
MVTPQHGEVAAGIRKCALLHGFDPGAEDSDRDIMLFFACDRTSMTADASILIDYKAETFRTHSFLQDDQAIVEDGISGQISLMNTKFESRSLGARSGRG